MDRGVSIPTIDIAVSLRTLSAYKEERVLHQKFILKHIRL
jgi:6-phosphogluconate dehydrogenase